MVPMLESYVKKILGSRVYDLAEETPLSPAPLLSKRLGTEVMLKREDLQSVFSFKLRGSYNKMAQMSVAEQQRGVIAASAGWKTPPGRYGIACVDCDVTRCARTV